MKDILRIAHKVLGEIDLRVLPEGVALQVAATRKLIENELEKDDAVQPKKKVAKKKPAKKKVVKKATKKKVVRKKR